MGFFLNGIVTNIFEKGFEVSYENGWKKSERVKFEQCRFVDLSLNNKENRQEFKKGDTVDAYVEYQGEKKAWHTVKISSFKNGCVIVEGKGQKIKKPVPIVCCRHRGLSVVVTRSLIHSCVIPIDDSLKEFEEDEEHYKILHHFVSGIWIKLDKEKKRLVIAALSPSITNEVEKMKHLLLFYSKQKISLCNFHQDLQMNPEPNIVEHLLADVDASDKLMRAAINFLCPKIKVARKIGGIKDIIPSCEKPHRKFKIYADSCEAAKQAADIMEVSTGQEWIPIEKVQHFVGEKGDRGDILQKIMDLSGLINIEIGDEKDDMIAICFTGNFDARKFARLMIDLQLANVRVFPRDLSFCKNLSPNEFVLAAKKYYEQTPPDLIQVASSLWLAASHSLIIFF